MRCLALALFLCAACSAEKGAGDSIRLPVVAASGSLATGSGVVQVTRDGRIFHAGKQQTVNELIKAARESPLPRPFELRADRDAIWMHVQWVMAALGEAGHTDVLLAVDVPGGGEGAVHYARLKSGYFEDRFDWFELVDWTQEKGQILEYVTVIAGPPVEYEFGDGSATTRDPAAVGRWAVQARAEAKKVFFALDAAGAAPYQVVLAALVQLQRPEVQRVEVGLEALHPWDRDLPVLPPPPHGDPVRRWLITDLSFKDLVPMNLPVASMAERDKADDPADRVILNLTKSGFIPWKGKKVSLDELGTILRNMKDGYDLKMKRQGKTGFCKAADGAKWSELYVLLRADQDVPWRHVKWVLAELAERRFYKIQLGARKSPGPEYTQAEAERRWAASGIYGPPLLEAKLACFQSTTGSWGDSRARYLDVHLVGTPVRYVFSAKEYASADAFVPRLLDAERLTRDHRSVGRIHAGPRTPFGKVVAAVNSFAQAGIEAVDLAGIERASPEIRSGVRLPD